MSMRFTFMFTFVDKSTGFVYKRHYSDSKLGYLELYAMRKAISKDIYIKSVEKRYKYSSTWHPTRYATYSM